MKSDPSFPTSICWLKKSPVVDSTKSDTTTEAKSVNGKQPERSGVLLDKKQSVKTKGTKGKSVNGSNSNGTSNTGVDEVKTKTTRKRKTEVCDELTQYAEPLRRSSRRKMSD